MSLHRSDPRAQNHLTLVAQLSELLQEQVDAKRGRFERLLGANLEPLLGEIKSRLAADGRSLGGKKETGCSKKEVLALVRTVVADRRALPQPAVGPDQDPGLGTAEDAISPLLEGCSSSPAVEEVFLRLAELYDAEAASKAAKVLVAEGKEQMGSDDEVEEDSIGSGSEEEPDDDAPAMAVVANGPTQKLPPKKKKGKSKSSVWAWKKELSELLHKMGGLEKINATRPSTAPFGNWGVMGGLRRLNDGRLDSDLTCSLLMGRRSKAATQSAALSAKQASSFGREAPALPPYAGLGRDDSEAQVPFNHLASK